MKKFLNRACLGLVGLCLCAGSVAGRADVLSGNLTNTTGGTETAQGTNWLTANFATGTSAYRLDSITLLLANTSSGAAELDLYSDGGLEPGALVGALTSPAGYAAVPSAAAFTANGIILAANTTYWIVLKATSGAFGWAWTADNTGSGIGFEDTWGAATDAGATWFTYDTYPTQMSVSATAAAPGAVSGRVALEGVADFSAINPAVPTGPLQILFRTPGTETTLYSASAALNPVGAGSPFAVYTSAAVPAGTYDIALKTSSTLQVVEPGVVLYGATTLPDFLLPAGDANNDNVVDTADFNILVAAFGGNVRVTGSNYEAGADFNRDGVVDTLDFNLLIGEFGSAGAP